MAPLSDWEILAETFTFGVNNSRQKESYCSSSFQIIPACSGKPGHFYQKQPKSVNTSLSQS